MIGQFYPKSVKEIRLSDITSKLVLAREVNFLFNVNFLTMFTNTMGIVDGLKELRSEWDKAEVQETKGFTRVGSLETFKNEAEEKLSLFFTERVLLEDDIRKASLEYLNDDDRNGDDDGDINGDDEGNDKEPYVNHKEALVSDDGGIMMGMMIMQVGNTLDEIDEDLERMEVTDATPLTPESLATRAAKSTIGVTPPKSQQRSSRIPLWGATS
ncbi:hypothetical protein Tco_0341238 [Tanacetum coccineum]